MAFQSNQRGVPQPNAITPSSRIWDFMRMDLPTIHGTKLDEYPQSFLDEVFKFVDAMGVNPREKAKLKTYKLKYVAQMLFEKWRD